MTSLLVDQCIKGSYGSESRRHFINSEQPKLKQSDGKKKKRAEDSFLLFNTSL